MVHLRTTPDGHSIGPSAEAGAPELVHAIRHETGAILRTSGAEQWVLAVSGGADSMVLLDAAVAAVGADALVVATFDHATGQWARQAAEMVVEVAQASGTRVVAGHMPAGRPVPKEGMEAEWRAQRWTFLTEISEAHGAPVVTAHTRDDQVETVFMRVLRAAGPRGLAALYAPSPIIRPLLSFTRSDVLRYAEAQQVTFVNDPSNADRRYLRNRIRHDLLPAITRTRPAFAEELLQIAKDSAVWRERIEQIAATFTVMADDTGAYHISRVALQGYTPAALGALWPALAARAGVILDWRGTERLATFTIEGTTGQSIQLSGGVEVIMRRDAMVVRRWRRNG